MPTTESTPLQMLRLPEVVRRSGLSRSTIYQLAAEGKFPRQVRVSENVSAWVASEVDEYLAERIALRDSA